MKGYSRSKEDFRHVLYSKYISMEEAIFIEGDSCSKCTMMKPHVQKRAEENGYEFQAVKFDDVSVKEFDIQSVPMLVLRTDDMQDILNEERIVHLISNK